MRERRAEVEDWLEQLRDEEEVLLRDTREVRNASEVKELILELLRDDPDIRNELVVSEDTVNICHVYNVCSF